MFPWFMIFATTIFFTGLAAAIAGPLGAADHAVPDGATLPRAVPVGRVF
jgi:hypothetical protein